MGPGLITRTILAIVIASIALALAVYWASLFPFQISETASVAGVIASFAMDRYVTAAVPAVLMLFGAHSFAYGPNPIKSIMLAAALALALVLLATLMLGVTRATDDRSAQAAANFVAYIAVLAASLHSMDVLTLKTLGLKRI